MEHTRLPIKEESTYTNDKNLSEEDIYILAELAKSTVFEPFENIYTVKTLKKTSQYLKQYGNLVYKKTKDYSNILSKKIIKKNTLNRPNSFLKNKKIQSIPAAYTKTQEFVSNQLRKIIYKALTYFLNKNLEKWIIKNTTLLIKPVNSLEEIQRLTFQERQILLDRLYPFEKNNAHIFLNKVRIFSNYAVGVMVASNIPFTGLVGSSIEFVKTLYLILGRLRCLCVIYGYKIANKDTFFYVASKIIQSIHSFEYDEDHQPLDCSIIDTLFENTSHKSIDDLMTYIALKEAYISIPGIGMISLAKINLDDENINIYLLNLFKNYAHKKALIEKYGEEIFQREFLIMRKITLAHQKFQFINTLEDNLCIKEKTKWYEKYFNQGKMKNWTAILEKKLQNSIAYMYIQYKNCKEHIDPVFYAEQHFRSVILYQSSHNTPHFHKK